MNLLEESSSDEETKEKFTINKDYADRYEKWRGKEHLQKLKAKHGDIDEEESDSESEESEDSDAEELTEEVEKDFYKTLACLKAKDPKIYDKDATFFESKAPDPSDSGGKSDKSKKKDKKITIGDMERKIMLEKGGTYDEMEDNNLKNDQGQTYVEEMKDIKKSLKDAIATSSTDEDDSEEDGLLQPRSKTKVEKEKEEEDYKAWLAGQTESISDEGLKSSMSGLKSFWSKSDLDDGEKFLKDYILNKRYKDSDQPNYVPTYEQVVHDSDEGLSEDERNVEKQEEFEHKFNFRFEEPDEEFIKRYPRTIKNSLRQVDDKRKKKRKEVEERKKQEKQQKKEEIKVLKDMKKKEILDKLDKLKKITGNEDMALRDEDIEGDFDPAEYDRRMQELFENYDNTNADDEKPEFSDLEDDADYGEELETEDWDNWTGPGGDDTHCEDPDFNMDCDYSEPTPGSSMQNELIENSRGRKKSRRKSKFSNAIEGSQSKPVFDPSDKTFEEYVDEYYKLDCEDVIGDLPCRFKYRSVEANDFGLSTDEILTADDKELNAWVSLRKTCQYRSAEEERRDVHAYKIKQKNEQLKKKILPSIFTTDKDKEEVDPSDNSPTKTKKKKKKNKKRKAESEQNGEAGGSNHAKKARVEQKTVGSNSATTPAHNSPLTKVKIEPSNAKGANFAAQNAGPLAANPGGHSKKIKRRHKKGRQTASSETKQPTNWDKKKSTKSTADGGGKPSVAGSAVSNDRLKAYGLNPSKYNQAKRKEKYKNSNAKKS